MATTALSTPQGRSSLRRLNEEEIEQARESSRRLDATAAQAGADDQQATVHLEVRDKDGIDGDIEIPSLALDLLREIMAELAKGHAVRVLPVHAELTTQEAADLLGVSRPHLAKLVDIGALPSRKVGTHRRVALDDLMEYKARTYEARSKVLDELVAGAQELGMGY